MFSIKGTINKVSEAILVHMEQHVKPYIKRQHSKGVMLDDTPLPRYESRTIDYKVYEGVYTGISNLQWSGLLHDTMQVIRIHNTLIVLADADRLLALQIVGSQYNKVWEHWYGNNPIGTQEFYYLLSDYELLDNS